MEHIKRIKEKRERRVSESDEYNSPKILHKDGYSSSSLNELEDLVTCYIHRGRLKDPRLLPCGHAFCRQCLDNLVSANVPKTKLFNCPLCRASCSTESKNILDFPKAWTHNRLADYIFTKRNKQCKRFSFSESISGQAELLRHFLQDIANSEESYSSRMITDETAIIVDKLKGVLHSMQMEETVASSLTRQGIYSSSDEENDADVNCMDRSSQSSRRPSQAAVGTSEINLEREAIKDTMKKHRYYKHCFSLCRDSGQQASNSGSALSPIKRHHSVPAKATHIYSENILFVDTKNNNIIIRNIQDVHTKGFSYINLSLEIDGQCLKPYFVRICRGYIYVTGTIWRNSDVTMGERGILARYSMIGQLIEKSALFAISESAAFPIGGFCMHPVTGAIFLALPGESRVTMVCGSTLTETDQSYSFPDFTPTFISHKIKSNELWISCPAEKQILILDCETGEYSQLNTCLIYDAVPSHIVCTVGENHPRVLFLDSEGQQIFWVIKHGSTIEIQRLIYSRESLNEMNIQSISELSTGRVMLVSEKNISVIKPKKNDASCILL